MTNTRDIIIKLKEVREQKGLSYQNIRDLMEANGDYVAKSTISRVFAEGSEDMSFKYEETIKPIANALLDIDTIEDDDSTDIQAMKYLLKFKIQRIQDLEDEIALLNAALDHQKVQSQEKLDEQREQFESRLAFLDRHIELLSDQLAYKDKRMDLFMESNIKKDEQMQKKDEQMQEMMQKILLCQKCKMQEERK